MPPPGRRPAVRRAAGCKSRAPARERAVPWTGETNEFAVGHDPGRLQRARLRARTQNKSEAERKKGCTKQLEPGGAAGGCAFDGAKIALQPFTDVAHLVHGPIACEGNSWDNRGAKSSGSNIWRTGFTTDINETDVVFGGEKRLLQGDQGNHREVRSAGDLRLSDLRARHDRRRHRRGVQGGAARNSASRSSRSTRRASSGRRISATSSPARRCSST